MFQMLFRERRAVSVPGLGPQNLPDGSPGTMDAQENPFANIDGNRLYEVQNYIIKTGHIYDTSPLLASKTWWDSLSSSDQELIQECVDEMIVYERELSASNETVLTKSTESI
uniref:hypothetical protein n=1 Tax=Enterocloster clostridioformis TaxID=1531 RepID=UPI0026EA1E8E|nr:hypothetical protein [Enterocloster clostridioformis]